MSTVMPMIYPVVLPPYKLAARQPGAIYSGVCCVHMHLSVDRLAISGLLFLSLVLATLAWLRDNPQHNPWAPLKLEDRPGWATSRKLAAVRTDFSICQGFVARSGLAAMTLPPVGKDECRREDRRILDAGRLASVALAPARAEATCAVDAGLLWWLHHHVQPQAQAHFGQSVVRIEHLGTVSCRRVGNGDTGRWSEHAKGNAIDIGAFVLENGTRIGVREGWNGDPVHAAFLRSVRDGACSTFATVLSPDYNSAHSDHFHLDQASRSSGWSYCR